jgi:hypothetical protein
VGSHDELVAAVVSALEHELPKYCKRNLVQYALRPMMGRHLRSRRRPDIRLGNMVIEVEAPRSGLEAGRSQLHQYMRDLASTGAVARRGSRSCHQRDRNRVLRARERRHSTAEEEGQQLERGDGDGTCQFLRRQGARRDAGRSRGGARRVAAWREALARRHKSALRNAQMVQRPPGRARSRTCAPALRDVEGAPRLLHQHFQRGLGRPQKVGAQPPVADWEPRRRVAVPVRRGDVL